MNHRIKELENERDKHASRVEVLEIQLSEAQQIAAVAEQQTAVRLQLLQQDHQEELATAEQRHHETRTKMQQQLEAAQQQGAASKQKLRELAEGIQVCEVRCC